MFIIRDVYDWSRVGSLSYIYYEVVVRVVVVVVSSCVSYVICINVKYIIVICDGRVCICSIDN